VAFRSRKVEQNWDVEINLYFLLCHTVDLPWPSGDLTHLINGEGHDTVAGVGAGAVDDFGTFYIVLVSMVSTFVFYVTDGETKEA